jgi:phosphoserine phosphatase
MSAPQNIVAVVFDFDDTLTDDSATVLLEQNGIDARAFWQGTGKLIDDGWDPPQAYLSLLLDQVGKGKPLGILTNAQLRAFGGTLKFYTGIPELFDNLRNVVKEHRLSSPSIEFYIISSGLEEVIRGTSIASYFTEIWGARFAEIEGQVVRIINTISFTEKTKYLFAINKGLERQCRRDPYTVNQKIAPDNRRVPFRNMIYVGDGITDVPCFSLMEQYDGKAFGVFDPTKDGSPKKAWEQLVAPKRVTTMNSPRYGKKDDLGALLEAAVRQICLGMDVQTGTAGYPRGAR